MVAITITKTLKKYENIPRGDFLGDAPLDCKEQIYVAYGYNSGDFYVFHSFINPDHENF